MGKHCTVKDSCHHFKVREAICKSRHCKNHALAGYRRCIHRPRPHVLPALHHHHVFEYTGSCRHAIRRLRSHLYRAQHAAGRCGLTNASCQHTRYRRVARIRAHLARKINHCRGHIHLVSKNPCHRVHSRLLRYRLRRKAILHRSKRCSDESVYCVKNHLRKVYVLNRKIIKLARRCSVKLPAHVRHEVHHIKVPGHVDESKFMNAVSCDRMARWFKLWVKHQHLKKKMLHEQACKCNPLDAGCLGFAYKRISHVARRIRYMRNKFAEKLRVCDECSEIKLQFRRWMRRQRERRRRLHAELCKCRVHDVECVARRGERIKKLAREILRRRHHVLHLHGECHKRGGTDHHWEKTTHLVKVPHTIVPDVFRASSAFKTGASFLLIAIATLAVLI